MEKSNSSPLRILKLPPVLLALVLTNSTMVAQQPPLLDGDLLVGAGHYGADAGIIARVRDGNAVTYCEPGSLNFYAPHEVMVDSQGRVVFVAMLGPVGSYGHGLFRCDSMKAETSDWSSRPITEG